MEFWQFYLEYPIIPFYFGIVNILAFAFYYIDKYKARTNAWRIRERTLLLLACAGGSVGALAAMKLFRHKLRKDSFMLWFVLIIALQALLIFYLPTAVDYLINLDVFS